MLGLVHGIRWGEFCSECGMDGAGTVTGRGELKLVSPVGLQAGDCETQY